MVLNFAGIETRLLTEDITTQIRPDAPALQIAVGEVQRAEKGSLYQQLHSYPVGNSGTKAEEGGVSLANRARGSKFWISTARRELLVDLDCVLGLQSPDPGLLDRIAAGLHGDVDSHRYGLPFAGDNNLLLDTAEVLPEPPPASWYTVVGKDSPPAVGSCRLTVGIDRADSSKTRTLLFAPTQQVSEPPENAWVWTPRAP